MSERENILARIREALRSASHSGPSATPPAAEPASMESVLPPVGGTREEWVRQFEAESRDLRTDFHLVSSDQEWSTVLQGLRQAESWSRVAAHRGELTERAVAALGLACVWMEDAPGAAVLAACDVGVTACDCLVAQTGTVVVTSRSAGGRGLSVLPPHHVVLARREQIVGGLPDAFDVLIRRYGPDFPSMMSFITGPSRTGDIERILVLGAHGPRKLTVLCR